MRNHQSKIARGAAIWITFSLGLSTSFSAAAGEGGALVAAHPCPMSLNGADAEPEDFLSPEAIARRDAPDTRELVKIEKGTWKVVGLTPEGLDFAIAQRDIIRYNFNLLGTRLKKMESYMTGFMTAFLLKQHVALMGLHGGGKSMLAKEMFTFFNEPLFQLLMDPMMSPIALVGGQDFESAKRGEYLINIRRSMANAQIAFLDEGDKANAATLSTMLSLLDGQREIKAGFDTFPSRLETVAISTNAVPGRLHQFFERRDWPTTARAFLDRFAIKMYFDNWLDQASQAELDARNAKKRYLMAIAANHPEVLADAVFLEPKPVDWKGLRRLLGAAVSPDDNMAGMLRMVLNNFRNSNIEAVERSRAERKGNRGVDAAPFDYVPTWDASERSRQPIPDAILASVLIDLLRSPLADDNQIEATFAGGIRVDTLSIWRAYRLVTMVGPGETRLRLKRDSNGIVTGFEIQWGDRPDPKDSPESGDKAHRGHSIAEQDRFNAVFRERLDGMARTLEIAVRNMGNMGKGISREGPKSIELMILNALGGFD